MARMNNIVVIMAVLAVVTIVCQAYPESQSSQLRSKRASSICNVAIDSCLAGIAIDPDDVLNTLLDNIIALLNCVINSLTCIVTNLLIGVAGSCASVLTVVLPLVGASLAAITAGLGGVLASTGVCYVASG